MFRWRKHIRTSTLLLLLLMTLGFTVYGYTAIGVEESQSWRGYQSTKATQIEEGYITTDDGVRLFYQKVGAGRVIIIPGRLFAFDVLRQLADRHTVISYDMRNRGRSDAVADGSKITIHHDVKDLEKVRQHFGVKKFHTIGYSYLGMMVIMYAMEYPQYVDRIVQIGAVPLKFGTEYPTHLTAGGENTGANPEEVAKVNKLREEGYDKSNPRDFCEKQWQVNRYNLVGNPANVGKLGKGVCDMANEWPVNFARHLQHHFVGSVMRLNIPKENVAKVARPVLTIHGTKDRNAPYGAGREWALMLPNARLLTVKDAAHQVFAEYPEIVLPAIRIFLNGKWPPGVERVTEKDGPKMGR
jgi:proline iminopeptidase